MRGSIQKRALKSGGVSYVGRVDMGPDGLGGRRQRSKAFSTRKLAQEWVAKTITEVNTGAVVEPSAVTVAQVLESWLNDVAAMKVRPSTLSQYRDTVRVHIIPEIGSLRIQRLTAQHVQSFYTRKIGAGASPRTIQLCHLRLSQALAHAVRQGVLHRNVCDAVDKPKVTYKPGKIWSAEETQAFLTASETDNLHPLWTIMVATGLRRGEALGLRWQDVDLESGWLRVSQSVGTFKGSPLIQEPKTISGRRTVKLPRELIPLLAEHKVRQSHIRESVGDLWLGNDLVFCTAIGKPLNPNNIYRNFNAIIQRSGVPRIRVHDLRHTHASLLLQAGQPIKVVSERLGHARTSTTLDTYAHLLPGMQDAAADVLSSLLFTHPRAS